MSEDIEEPIFEETFADRYTFLGNEFLMWLWFKSDCFDGVLPVSGHDTVELSMGDHLRFSALALEKSDREQTDLRGNLPGTSPEAKLAVLQGKVLVKAKVELEKEAGRKWSFMVDGETFNYSGVVVPAALGKDDAYEAFYERMALLEELEEIMEILYYEFFKIRESSKWTESFLPSFKKWLNKEALSSRDDYPKDLLEFEKGKPLSTFKKANAGYYQGE